MLFSVHVFKPPITHVVHVLTHIPLILSKLWLVPRSNISTASFDEFVASGFVIDSHSVDEWPCSLDQDMYYLIDRHLNNNITDLDLLPGFTIHLFVQRFAIIL